MNDWTPPSRSWSPQARVGAMALLVGAAWLTAGWPGVAGWPGPIALLWLAIGSCHAAWSGAVAMFRRQRRRAVIEAALCVLFVGAMALASYLVLATADVSSPC